MVPSIATPRHKSDCKRPKDCVVLALNDDAQAAVIRMVLRRLGWSVHQAATAAEARRLVAECRGGVAILGTDFADESGWLTCAKLTVPPPHCTVLMVGPDTPRNRMMARSAGARALLTDPVEVADWVPPARMEQLN
jgi:DNA-binding response OmpR family regulator